MKNLALTLKKIKKLEKEDSDLYEILIHYLALTCDSGFRGSEEIDVSKRLWNRDWTYHVHKQTKRKVADYDERIREIGQKQGSEGWDKFCALHEEVYDAAVYGEQVTRLQQVVKKLKALGFKVRLHYTKNYRQKNIDNLPEGLYLIIRN